VGRVEGSSAREGGAGVEVEMELVSGDELSTEMRMSFGL